MLHKLAGANPVRMQVEHFKDAMELLMCALAD
jgi:hypothetical protein